MMKSSTTFSNNILITTTMKVIIITLKFKLVNDLIKMIQRRGKKKTYPIHSPPQKGTWRKEETHQSNRSHRMKQTKGTTLLF